MDLGIPDACIGLRAVVWPRPYHECRHVAVLPISETETRGPSPEPYAFMQLDWELVAKTPKPLSDLGPVEVFTSLLANT